MKYQVIVCDCPWDFSDSLSMSSVKRGATANYQTMSITDIKQLAVPNIVDPDGCMLVLWVPSSLLQEGLDVMKAWGFEHKQTYIWVKVKKPESLKKKFEEAIKNIIGFNLSNLLGFGMGRLFRQSHELALVGINNTKIYKTLKNKSQRSVILSENFKHSKKPEELQDSLELMFPQANKLEIFARRIRPNWTCIGNEVCQGEDIRVSLSKL